MVKRMINTQRLVDIRELYGFSKEKLASKLNVNRKEVVKLEKGVIDPNFIIIRKLTELFSVCPNYFFNVSNIPHVAQNENLTHQLKKLDRYELKYIDFIHYYIEYFEQFVTINHHDILPNKISDTYEFYQALAYKKEQGYFQIIIYNQRLLNMVMHLYTELDFKITDLTFDNSDMTQKAHVIIDRSYQNSRQIVWANRLDKNC